MKDAAHQWTVNVNQKFDLETLKQYNGVFVGGNPLDNQVLIDYVKSGGNVYLMGGTSAVNGTSPGAAKVPLSKRDFVQLSQERSRLRHSIRHTIES